MATATPGDAPERAAGVAVALAVAVVAISTAAPAIRLTPPLRPEAVACLRVSVTTLALAVLTLPATARALRLLIASPREAKLTLLAGLCLAAHFEAWIASLWMTSVVRSVALVTTQPLWAGLLARAVGDEAPRRIYLGALVAVAGTVIMAAEPGALAGGSWRGDLLALSGALTAAVHLAIGRHVHARLGDALPVEGYFVIMNLVAALALWAVVFARGVAVTPAQTGAGATALLAILWLGLIPGVIGHGLLNWSVRRVPVHTVAMAVMLEPVGAAGIAWLALGESVAPREGLGALVLLAGVGLGLPRRRP